MADQKSSTNTVLNKIDAMLSAVKFYSDDNGNVSLYLSDNLKNNVINFIVDFFEKTKGKEWLVKIMSKFISYALVPIEYSIKLILLGYVESMLSCSTKPIITKKMILDGVYFDLQDIDLFNILKTPPAIGFDTKSMGRYLYFGTKAEDGVYTIDDLYQCRDFNAFLWYTKNCPGKRVVWKREKDVDTASEIYKLSGFDVIYTTIKTFEFPKGTGKFMSVNTPCVKVDDKNYVTLTNVIVVKDGILQDGFTTPVAFNQDKFAKQPKKNGIITLEYANTTDNFTDAEHNLMEVQEPLSNVLHVFIGCCDEVNRDKQEIEEQIKEINKKLSLFSSLQDTVYSFRIRMKKLARQINRERNSGKIETLEAQFILNSINGYSQSTDNATQRIYTKGYIDKLDEFSSELISSDKSVADLSYEIFGNDYQNGKITFDVLTHDDNTQDTSITIDDEILNISRQTLYANKRTLVQSGNQTSVGIFPTAVSNYYYLHPLLEFNSDLIFSMQLFEPQTLAAQLINAICGCLEYGADSISMNGLLSANCSIQEQIIKAELGGLIEKIIENDDDIVNDCFFTFDNTSYNTLIQKTEMKRLGLYSNDGINASSVPNPAEVMSAINELSGDASKEEIQTAIEHSLFSAMSYRDNSTSDSQYGLNFSLNSAFGITGYDNLLQVIIKKLIYAIVSIVLMPKIYLVIMFNLKILGNDTNSSFDLTQYIDYCKSMLIDIIKKIKEEVVNYFKDMIMEILNELLSQFKTIMLKEQYEYYKNLLSNCTSCYNSIGTDWQLDNVQYADITDPVTSTNDEC